jgi:anti-sigma-K factor RskA
MSGAAEREEQGGDGMLAAEYVLGVLPAAERTAAAARIGRDRAFAGLVERWEEHLAPLDAAYVGVEAPERVKAALDRRLFARPVAVPAAGGGVWTSLAFWRGLAAAALAALAIYAALPFALPRATAPQLVASLQPQGSDVQFVALFDGTGRQVALSHVSGDTGADRDFQLWLIEGGSAPVSVGVLPGGAAIRIELSQELRRRLAAGAVLAISLEPEGGSPTGQPTGPVVAAGDLREI